MSVVEPALPVVIGWDAVPGQDDAVARLRAAVESPVHAYLFVGPEGSGKRAALRAFAGERFAATAGADAESADRHRRLAAVEHHPDLIVVEPEGSVFRGGKATADGDTEAAVVIREAHRSPVESSVKIVAAEAFHTANETAVGALLKTIEEPPARTTIVLLAESVPPAQSAIVSRCVRIDFHAVDAVVLQAQLVAEGVEAARAELAGRRGRRQPRPRPGARHRRTPRVAGRGLGGRSDAAGRQRLDGHDRGGELRAMLDDALAPVVARHELDLAAFDVEVEEYGLTSTTGRRNASRLDRSGSNDSRACRSSASA